MFHLIGLTISISLFAQDSLFAQQNNGQEIFFGNSPEKVIQYAGWIHDIMINDEIGKIWMKDIKKPQYNRSSFTDNLAIALNDSVATFNCYIDFINFNLIELDKIYQIRNTNNPPVMDRYVLISINCFFNPSKYSIEKYDSVLINDQALYKYFPDRSKSIQFERLNTTNFPRSFYNDPTNLKRAKEYAAHMNIIFNQLAQMLQIDKTGYSFFLNELNYKLKTIHKNRDAIFKWYRDLYCNKQYISDNFQSIFFLDDVSNLDSSTTYRQDDVFLINDLYKRENVSARERHQFFIKNQESQANTQKSFVAQKVYDFMDDEWGVRFTYHDKLPTESQSDCDYRPWLVIGSFLQFVSVNRYNSKDLLEFFPGQPGDFKFDWNCLQDDDSYPKEFNSFLEKWINDKFAYDCKLETGLTEAEKTEALLSILKEQLNIVKPRLRYIKNHTTVPGVAEFIRHIINED